MNDELFWVTAENVDREIEIRERRLAQAYKSLETKKEMLADAKEWLAKCKTSLAEMQAKQREVKPDGK